MAQKKKATVKKTKQKQNVNVNVVVNSNNRRKVVANPKAPSQSQPVYIPSSSQSTPTIVLKQESQPHPATNTDVASHIESVIKKVVPASQTLASTVKEPEKQLIHAATEPAPSLNVKVEKPETELTPANFRKAGILEPKSVHSHSDSESPDLSYSDSKHSQVRRFKYLSDSDAPSAQPSRFVSQAPTKAPTYAAPSRAMSLISEGKHMETQTPTIRKNRAGQASLVQFFNAHDIPIDNTNLSAMKEKLKERGLLDDYYQKPKGRGKKTN